MKKYTVFWNIFLLKCRVDLVCMWVSMWHPDTWVRKKYSKPVAHKCKYLTATAVVCNTFPTTTHTQKELVDLSPHIKMHFVLSSAWTWHFILERRNVLFVRSQERIISYCWSCFLFNHMLKENLDCCFWASHTREQDLSRSWKHNMKIYQAYSGLF